MDLRVEKTYKALTDAFTGLFEEMPFEDVSVAQLCDRAMVRRTTFYRHFADKDEFLRFYVLSLRDEIEARALHGDAGVSLVEYNLRLTKGMRAFCLEHGRMVENALRGVTFGTLYVMLCDVVQRTMMVRLQVEVERGAAFDVPIEGVARFLAGGLIQMTLSWWLAGHPLDTSKDDATIEALINRLLSEG